MKKIQYLEQWFRVRGSRERISLFSLGIILIYAICMILFIHPQMSQKRALSAKIIDLQTQQTAMRQQIDLINDAAKNGNLLKMLNQQKNLNLKIQSMQETLSHMKLILVSVEEVSKITKAILTQEGINMDRVNLKDSPPQPWTANPQEFPDVVPMITSPIFERDLQVEFQSDYFNTINYINHLEKLPWPIYWDSLSYTVLQYPKANIVIKFHVLTN